MNQEKIRAIIKDSPLADHADEIMKLALPAVKMNAYLVESGDLPKGASRMGGAPDLPEAATWPTSKGRPIEFLVQINLAEASQAYAVPGIPETGWLLLFHDFKSTFEGDRESPGLWQVVHFDDPADSLRRVEPPAEPVANYNFCELTFERELCLPGDFTDRFEAEDDDGEAWEYFDSTLWAIENGPYHRLGGFPMLIQSDQSDYRALEFLMQIDSDDEFGWMWGDMGRVYCWTRRKDLLRRIANRFGSAPDSAWKDREFLCGDEFY
jgi:uncharacterized protein YwqG